MTCTNTEFKLRQRAPVPAGAEGAELTQGGGLIMAAYRPCPITRPSVFRPRCFLLRAITSCGASFSLPFLLPPPLPPPSSSQGDRRHRKPPYPPPHPAYTPPLVFLAG